MTYDEAVELLYRAPLDEFVAERKRLAAELKAGADAAAATRLSKLARPSMSAWAVNQLWWRARDTFDELFEAAERLRQGDLSAMSAHREALGALRARAAALLTEAGHAAAEATLRRVAASVSALAAAGGFDPDPPGALSADRESPGFDAVSPAEGPSRRAPSAPAIDEDRKRVEQELERAEEERARKQAERERLASALAVARAELVERTRAADRLRSELAAADQAVERARSAVEALDRSLAELD